MTTTIQLFLFFLLQGNYFLFIELTSQLHRTLVPIPVWLFYLLDHNDRIPAKVLGVILTAAYMVFKGKSILITALAWKVAASKLLQSTVSTFFLRIFKIWQKGAKVLARVAFLFVRPRQSDTSQSFGRYFDGSF